MRAWQLARVASFGVTLALFGCDSGGDPTPTVDASGGTGGDDMGQMDAAGGVGGGDADMGDMGGAGGGGPCACGEACAEPDCVEAQPCTGDVECQGSRICEGDTCVAGCADDAACAGSPDAPFCIEGRCGNCASDDDCFGASTCGADRRCVAPDRCTASRECLDEVCDFTTGDCQPAFDCRDEGSTCPGRFACQADSGVCRPNVDDTCADSEECPFGQVCVEVGRDMLCGTCLVDGDCPGRQTCMSDVAGNRCVEAAVCDLDDDCIGGRVCDGGTCAPAQCVDDPFAGNDAPGTARRLDGDLVFRGLMSCGPDWYVFTLPANTVGAVVLRQRDRDVDLDLALASADGRIIERASTGQATESLVITPSASEREVVIAVLQNGPTSSGAYDLEVSFSSANDGCLDDAFDVGAGDDALATARYVRGPVDPAFGVAGVSGRICAGDVDWICFSIQGRETFTATAAVVGSAVLTADLVAADSPDRVEASGTWGGAEPMDIEASLATGVYCLRATAAEGSAAYTFDLNAFTSAVRNMCRLEEPLLSAGETEATVDGELPRPANNSTSPACAGGAANGGEVAYTVEVDGPRLLTARVTGLGSGTLGDPVLSVRGGCTVAASELGCATGWFDPDDAFLPRPNPAQVRVALPEAGTYSLIVDGIETGNDATYRLAVETTGLAAPPENDSCEMAEPVVLDAGRTELSVNLDQASDSVYGCFGGGGPDGVFAVTLESDAWVSVRAFSQPSGFAVGAYLVQGCGGMSPMACGLGFEAQVPAGEYFLVVDGVDSNARGRAVLDVEVTPVGAPPANDVCADASPLVGPAGAVQGNTSAAADDYQLADNNRCTGHDSRGGDVAYRLPVTAGQRVFVDATPEGGWDLSLYVTADCGAPLGQCEGSDGALTESVVFVPEADGELFVVVDGSAGESGPFTLSWGPAECAGDADCGAGACVDHACQPAP